MPTKRKRRTRLSNRTLTRAQILQHLVGHDFFGAYGDALSPAGIDEDTMREDWELHADQIRDFRKDDRIRRTWPVYSALRFDQGMSHEEALSAMRAAR